MSDIKMFLLQRGFTGKTQDPVLTEEYQDPWSGKFVTPGTRLTWTRTGFKLEELPAKGKKQLRVATLQNVQGIGGQERWRDEFIAENIISVAKLGPNDDYDRVKDKIWKAWQAAKDKMPQFLAWVDQIQWYENKVHFLKVVPEGTEPVEAKGKDFVLKSEWTKFSSYSPDSDFQQSDPYYSQIHQTSAAAARKLYQLVKADPDLFKNMTWSGLSDWLRGQKIGYEYSHSVWH